MHRLQPRRMSAWTAGRWVEVASWTWLAVVCGVWGLLVNVSEDWWPGIIVTYAPRSLYLVPAVLLGVVAPFVRRRAAVPSAIVGLIVLGPVMGFNVPVPAAPAETQSPAPPEGPELCVLSCNVQSFRPAFGRIARELASLKPDVVCFQEAFESHPLLDPTFADWHVVRVDEYYVASRFPAKLLGTCHSATFDRITACAVLIEAPQGPVVVCNVHQTSPRSGLTALRPWSLFGGEAVEHVERHAALRDEEAATTREFAETHSRGRPWIVAGDFNMPFDSSLFRAHWGDLHDSFRQTQWGYGYTSPCQTQNVWPNGWPWLQVDHILSSESAPPLRCAVGTSNGSDHRLMAAWLRVGK